MPPHIVDTCVVVGPARVYRCIRRPLNVKIRGTAADLRSTASWTAISDFTTLFARCLHIRVCVNARARVCVRVYEERSL